MSEPETVWVGATANLWDEKNSGQTWRRIFIKFVKRKSVSYYRSNEVTTDNSLSVSAVAAPDQPYLHVETWAGWDFLFTLNELEVETVETMPTCFGGSSVCIRVSKYEGSTLWWRCSNMRRMCLWTFSLLWNNHTHIHTHAHRNGHMCENEAFIPNRTAEIIPFPTKPFWSFWIFSGSSVK